jgi:hypothetical protein
MNSIDRSDPQVIGHDETHAQYGGHSMMTFRALRVLILTVMVVPAIHGCAREAGPLTPYDVRDGSVRGATWEPGSDPDAELVRMRDEFRIDTVNVYGLQDWPPARLDGLFAALGRERMRLALRIEAYDPATFAFRDEDAARVVSQHRALLARSRGGAPIAYVAVNMPVDDPRVQARLGGIGSALSRERQTRYAAEIVRRLRAETDAKIYLGLFYGWDGSYPIPSYRGSGADGYVLTSYSYPGGDASTDAELIDEPRLRAVADRAVADHPGSPLIVEYGFQTLAAQRDRPDQTAGLVRDEEAKRRALRATTRFYRKRYPAVVGTMYFGWNVHKREGNPPRMLDYGLVPPPMPA